MRGCRLTKFECGRTYTQGILEPIDLSAGTTFTSGSTHAKPVGCARNSGCKKKLQKHIKTATTKLAPELCQEQKQDESKSKPYFCISIMTIALASLSMRIVLPRSTSILTWVGFKGGGSGRPSPSAMDWR